MLSCVGVLLEVKIFAVVTWLLEAGVINDFREGMQNEFVQK